MKTLIALALLLLASPAHAQIICDQFGGSTQIGAAPIVERVQGVAGKRVYICGYMLIHSGGADLDLEISSGQPGTDCAVSKTLLVPRLSLPASSAIVNRSPFSGEYAPLGNSVCIQTFGTGTLTGIFYWAVR